WSFLSCGARRGRPHAVRPATGQALPRGSPATARNGSKTGVEGDGVDGRVGGTVLVQRGAGTALVQRAAGAALVPRDAALVQRAAGAALVQGAAGAALVPGDAALVQGAAGAALGGRRGGEEEDG